MMASHARTRVAPADHGWGTPATRRWLLILACAYLLFVVYGSLVPLNYQALAWPLAKARFSAIPYLNLGIASRADWVANLLLFIPLTFLWSGAVWPRGGAGRQLAVASTVVLVAAALSVGIEFTQLYFPPRTVSINDIVAEAVGGIAGGLLWCWQGRRFARWTGQLPLAQGKPGLSQRLLAIYLLALFTYNLLPLDLTISPVEIYHKWRDGKVILVPFTTAYSDTAQQVYDIATDILLWLPAAVLWRWSAQRTAASAFWFVVGAATVLELLQLFVYSRVTDTTDVITAAIGAAISGVIGRPGAPAGARLHSNRGPPAWPWALAVIAWLGVLAVVFWYPFDFRLERAFLLQRVNGLSGVPFTAYYYGTEFRAITELLHKTLFLAPLGVALDLWRRRLSAQVPGFLGRLLCWSTMLACALGIEAGQLLLPGKIADITDAALEMLGAAAGYLASSVIAGRMAPVLPKRDAQA